MTDADLNIRGGMIYDGNGGEPYLADIGIAEGRIVRIGAGLPPAAENIDASGLAVTPGFVDVHAHLDGNVTWESRLKPASGHGITTAVMGNCGVGFAPARPDDRAFNVALMEGVEDIPAEQLNAGLSWSWQSFPEYLDYISARSFDMNVGALVPHSCLRVYVMGDRAIRGEAATSSDREQMMVLVAEAVSAGALGLGSTRLVGQKTRSGIPAPSIAAMEDEYMAIAQGLGETGILQIAPEFNQYPQAIEELEMIVRIARETGVKVTYSLKQTNEFPEGWRELLQKTIEANEEGLNIRPQVLARPTGAILSWESNSHPFSRCPSYVEIASLPLNDRLIELQTPARRQAIISEAEERPGGYAKHFSRMFSAEQTIHYEPAEKDSVVAESDRLGMSVQALLYQRFMENEGRGVILLASGNYARFSLEPALEMVKYEQALPGLGDAGAHSTVICDASATTHLLSYWVRDRDGERLAVPEVVRKLTSSPADFFGLEDRGCIREGAIADLNVIDLESLDLRLPRMDYDLPLGGQRLVQPAVGYHATLVAGEPVILNDEPTDRLPGRLLR